MRRIHLVALVVLALALGLLGAGCLDGTETTATADTVVGTLPTATTDTGDLPALELTGDPTAGKAVFASAGCAACHTLKAAGATGTVGPNLDQLKPAEDVVKNQVIHGGGPMPAFKGQLSDKQIQDVAAFVFASTH